MEELMGNGHGRESNDLVCGRKEINITIGSSIKSTKSIVKFIKKSTKVGDPTTFHDI